MNFKETESKIYELVTNFNMWLIKHYEDPSSAKEYYINNVILLAEQEVKDKIENLLKSYVAGLPLPEFKFKQLTSEDYAIISNKLKLANELSSTDTDYERARTLILSNYQDYDLEELKQWTSDNSLTAEYDRKVAFNEEVKKYHQHLQEFCKWSYLHPTALALGGYSTNYPLLKITLCYEFYNAESRLKAFIEEFKKMERK